MKKNAKSKRMDAEKAAVWFAHEIMGCVITRRAVRTQWQKVDFFGADVVGKDRHGCHVYIQATAGGHSAVTARRRKLEKIRWHKDDTVLLVQLVSTEDPNNARRKLWFFKVFEYDDGMWGQWDQAVPVDKHWFKAYCG